MSRWTEVFTGYQRGLTFECGTGTTPPAEILAPYLFSRSLVRYSLERTPRKPRHHSSSGIGTTRWQAASLEQLRRTATGIEHSVNGIAEDRSHETTSMPTQPHLFSHLLNPLQCTEQDNAILIELAETLVVHNVQQFSALELTKNGAPSNKNRWKEVRKREGTKVFKEKATKGEPLEMSSLMLMGTVVGKLEDFMYAVVAPSTEVMRIKSFIIQDGIVDCKVLHEVVSPTIDDPFHHISVRWRLFAEPDLRDYVCLDSTGIATSANGERIGYHLTHSVGFEQIPSFASYDVTRGNMSICSLYVQNTASTVQIYVRGFFDSNEGRNELVNNATMNAIASHWMSYPRKVECAQVKKLLWTMHKNNNRDSIMSLKNDGKLSMATSTPGLCKICSKSFGFLGTSRKICIVCNEQVCSRCSVAKTLAMLASNRVSVMEKKRVFCVQCISDVTNTDALRIAREEILNCGKLTATTIEPEQDQAMKTRTESDPKLKWCIQDL
ncbi:hypothetical protein L914_03646 [Phytophthora nicotianae]|uniref:FYVE-type domain-containing protein n=1 Tax=Phytophthora nicotianae TaxID=4792 RepID=W2NW43_PHYNI|nr:hypothetical protein L914_03646 [Phytophthora nicotianae]